MVVDYFTIVTVLLNMVFIVSVVNVFRLVKALIKKLTNQLDELEQKAVFDSLAISMLLILAMHIVQFAIGVFMFSKTVDYTPIIAPWAYIGRLSINFSNNPFFVRIDNLTFDIFVIGLVYLFTQLNYRLITKKQALKLYGVPTLIIIGIGVGGRMLIFWSKFFSAT